MTRPLAALCVTCVLHRCAELGRFATRRRRSQRHLRWPRPHRLRYVARVAGKKNRKIKPAPATTEPPDDGWVTWGGQRLYVVGHTAGGAPYGVTEEEWNRDDVVVYGPPWELAREVLARVLGGQGQVSVGRATRIGRGLSSVAFAAQVELVPDPDRRSGPYVVLLPHEDERESSRDDEILGQARLLAWLRGQALSFRVPEVVSVTRAAGGLALIERHLQGVELGQLKPHGKAPQPAPTDNRGGRAVLTSTAALAAAIHACRVPPEVLSGAATRREHARAHLEVFAGLPCDREPLLAAARAWGLAHLPTEEPAVLLHGDLLGPNILIHPTEPPAVVDWSAARLGDPAYDLAIVTRGARRPFGRTAGLAELLQVYREHGGAAVTADEVRLHELCLIAGWYERALGRRRGQPPQYYLEMLYGVLRRSAAEGQVGSAALREV